MKKLFAVFTAVLALIVGMVSCTEEPKETRGSLSGIVTASDVPGQPLKGVTVSVPSLGLSYTTGDAGSFMFTDIIPGHYTVQFMKSGYQTDSHSVSIEAGKTTNADMVMRPEQLRGELEFTARTLNFDQGISELTLGIRNSGTTAYVDWTISGVSASWLSVTPRSGSTRSGSTTTVKVSVNRELITASSVSTSFLVESEGYSTPINVVVTNTTTGGNQGESYGSIKGRAVDVTTGLGVGYASIILTPANRVVRADEYGMFDFDKVEPGDYTVEATQTDYETASASVVVNSGQSASVTIRMTKQSTGGDDNTGDNTGGGNDNTGGNTGGGNTGGGNTGGGTVTPDYSSARVSSCDYRVEAKVVGCRRSGSSVTFEYTLTNTGLGTVNDWRIYPPKSMSLINGGTRSSVWTNDGEEYLYPTITFRGASTSGSNVLNTSFPQGAPGKGTVTITGVSESATKFNLNLGVYAYPNSTYNMSGTVVSFLDVPIY